MAHHRGLIITVVVAIVIAVVGTGAMAWATNDTDESVESELAAAQFGLTSEGAAASSDYWQDIELVVYGNPPRGSPFKLTPDYDWGPRAQCVKRDASSPGDVHAPTGGATFTVGATVQGGAFNRCGWVESRMFWRLTNRFGESRVFALIKPAGGQLTASCNNFGGCRSIGARRLEIGV